MFINDAQKKEEIRTIVIQDLKQLGIKCKCKRPRKYVQEPKSRKVFKTALHLLPTETVTLPSGQQLVVPRIVHEFCSFVDTKIKTEGLFRKGGSKSRQNEIRLSLDAGCYLGDEHHEIDVAAVLKTFFRELPEPLIPYSQHELFLRCVLLEKGKKDAVLLSCLLLPVEHLNTLVYFMQFLNRVTEYQRFNKMDAYNLAVIIGPTLLPAEEKTALNATHRLTKTCELFKLLIENASGIGILTEHIIERIPVSTPPSMNGDDDSQSIKKKKKRRSGSLTRMLNGLKKIVSSKSEEAPAVTAAVTQGEVGVTPDLLLTPSITRSAKKRKLEGGGLSQKKRREILNRLPENAFLNSPFTPLRTPVNGHPNGRINKTSPATILKNKENVTATATTKDKKPLWSHKTRPKKQSDDTSSIISTSSLQRRWSAVSSAAGFRKKKTRSSCIGTFTEPAIENVVNEEIVHKKEEADYVRIPKMEYEEIKSRVSAIERCITELDNVRDDEEDNVGKVEEQYVKTLVQAEALSPTTDQLARRLSRDLKIRKSCEGKVIRSPSARKIGNMRRRSQEKVKLSRNQSWCAAKTTPQSMELSTDASSNWTSAEGFFSTPETSQPSLDNCRASIARIRSQNAGMVLAKARLFDNLHDSDTEVPAATKPLIQRNRMHKIGAARNGEVRQSCRVRALKCEERRLKKSMSPMKKRAARTSPGQNLVTTPRIKIALSVKSPRRVRNILGADSRGTPLRVTVPYKQMSRVD